jgi:hypothetical protein
MIASAGLQCLQFPFFITILKYERLPAEPPAWPAFVS